MRTLYHTPLSPYCRKVRILLREKELEFDLVQENFWERRQELFALNPAGEVPVLQEEDGELVCGSYAIMEYLEEAYRDNNKRYIGSSISERAEIRRIIDWFDRKFDNEVTQNILFEKLFKRLMSYGEPQSEAIRAGKKNILYHLDYIAYLTAEQQYLAGDTITLADITAAAHFSALDYLGDVPWEHNPKAKEWYAIMKSRPSMRAVLADRIPSVRPPAHYENPDF
ncbi:MAG TPA: glutathione S-transferase family protein [Rickettsiales bacterium]|nr:glutathione S-transferase family protein [Rickettsiales bacterium]